MKALLLDLGRVIIQLDTQLCFASWARDAKVPVEQIVSRHRIDSQYEDYECGLISGSAFFAGLREQLGIDLTDEQFEWGWNAMFLDPVPGMPELIQSISAKIPVYVFSNTNLEHYRYWYQRYQDILAPASAIYCSHEIGLRKPSPQAFEAVARRIGERPEHILFFDDLSENVEGAKLAGMQAEVFTSALSLGQSSYFRQ